MSSSDGTPDTKPIPNHQCDKQPNLMNVPRKTPTDAINSHGEPCIIRMTPQLMKKANSRNVRMARTNFIVRSVAFFVSDASASRLCGIDFPLPMRAGNPIIVA